MAYWVNSARSRPSTASTFTLRRSRLRTEWSAPTSRAVPYLTLR